MLGIDALPGWLARVVLAIIFFVLTLLFVSVLGPGLLDWKLGAVCFVFFLASFLIAGKPLYFGFGSDSVRRAGSWLVAGGVLFIAVYALWNVPSYASPA